MTVPAAGRVADAAPAAAARPAVTLPVERADTAPRESRLMVGGYIGLLTLVAVVTVGWLAVGAVVAVAAYRPEVAAAFTEAAQGGSAWARGVQAAIPRSEPFDQLVPDFAFSLLNLVIAVLLLWLGHRAWFIRLLAIAMIGSAGAFNLQAHAAAVAVQIATGLSMGTLHQILLHGVAGAAYILAMLVFPSSLWRLQPDSGLTRRLLLFAGLGALLVAGFATALLPHTTSCVLLFGFGVPLIGLAVLPRRIRRGPTAGQRTQARLLFSVLAAAFATTVVLGVITLLLVVLDWPGLTVHDPTAGGEHGEPTGLLFWFARLAAAAIAGAVLVASRRTRLWTAERLFSRGLATALLVTLLGGGYVVARAVTMVLLVNWPVAPVAATALPTALVALAALPLYVRVERLVDRLLYGTRPTPYSVLAEVAALSRATSTDAPDLTRMAEAVARGLGATSCSLTVFRAGLRDRTYRWSDTGSPPAAEDLVAVPIRHGEEQIGRIAVDRAAVAGLHAERAHLLADIADSLGVVLQASRFGIELERQLRAAVAHAEEIAVSRRQAVAEMDAERRRIERDLHDGAQHHLVSLSLTLGLVELQVATGDRDQARRQLDQVEEQLGTAEAVLAETATGVSSTALSTHGLYAALTADLAGGPAPVAVDTDDAVAGRRFPAEIEAAVYFCCLEAVNNARKHAPGAPIALRLAETDGRLTFTVRDDGPGFAQDRDPRAAGRGLRNVMTRISAVGGTIAVRSAPGAGTSMEGSVPVPAAPAPAAAGPPATPVAAAAPPDEPALVDQVREAVREAGQLYRDGPLREPVRELGERLEQPQRIAVSGPPGPGGSTVVAARANAVLAELDALVRSAPADEQGRRLRYRIDRIRAGEHELAEIELLDVLRAGDLPLPEDECRAAERLLGAAGTEPWSRLGLAADTGPQELHAAAMAQLARWRRRFSHPASTKAVRDGAEVLIRICERLLAPVSGE